MTEEEPLGCLLSPRTSWLTFPVSVDLEKLERDCLRYARYNSHVRNRDREWRARERAANAKPLSDKVSSRGGRVDVGPKAKPKGRSK